MYDPSLFRLEGGVALITGAGAGIGRSIAETFAAAGAAVTVTDRNLEAAESVAQGIVGSGGRAISVACDVTRESDLEASVNQTVAEFGSLDFPRQQCWRRWPETVRHAAGRLLTGHFS